MVFDVPAAEGGAVSILREYYEQALVESGPENEWVYVLGIPEFPCSEHVRILRFPWVKKSWLHRLWFDHCVAPRLVRTTRPDRILSLQNVLVPHVSVPQDLYLHQPLPFVEKRFGLFSQPVFWMYQNVLSHSIFRAVRKARRVTVQTRWMKEACVRLAGADPDRIEVVPPKGLDANVGRFMFEPESFRTFFYPTSEKIYKNHTTLIEAVARMEPGVQQTIRVCMTLRGGETPTLQKLFDQVREENLPVEWIGMIPHTEVMERYTRSVLVFPSYIETFGLPLLEARRTGTPVIASDCAFSREILEGYGRAAFFAPEDPEALARLLADCATGRLFTSETPAE